MKKFYFILISLFLVKGATGQSEQPCLTCLAQGITFSTQTQIDNFQANYPNCTQISGYVKIFGSNIINLNGLSVLTSIGGYLTIQYNSLTSLSGLEGLTSVGGTLSIDNNCVLTNLNGLAGLTSIGGAGLWISNNPVLTSLGMEGLISVDGGTQGGYLSITDNALLTDISGFGGLMSIGKDLRISTNPSLTSLTGFEGLTFVGEDLRLEGNTSLNSLTGMESLTSIGGGLILYWNSSLTSLSGLENINGNSVSSLTFIGNNSLSFCAIQGICDFLADPHGAIDIYDNASGCNSVQEVEAACAAAGGESLPPESSLIIHPNPASNEVIIEFSTRGQLSILNLNGQPLITRQITEPKTQINISTLPGGVYFVRLTGKTTVEVGKIIKQ